MKNAMNAPNREETIKNKRNDTIQIKGTNS